MWTIMAVVISLIGRSMRLWTHHGRHAGDAHPVWQVITAVGVGSVIEGQYHIFDRALTAEMTGYSGGDHWIQWDSAIGELIIGAVFVFAVWLLGQPRPAMLVAPAIPRAHQPARHRNGGSHLALLARVEFVRNLAGRLAATVPQTGQGLLSAEQLTRKTVREQAASDERRRIAREIHDLLGHSLSVTALHVTGARRALQQDGNIDEAVSALIDAEKISRRAMADIRRAIGGWHHEPTGNAAGPGIDDIADLIGDFQAAGLAVHYRIEGESDRVSPGSGLAVYRICQESLTNAVKHARASKADIILDISRTSIALSISNDLRGPQPDVVGNGHPGFGLRGMTQRAELLGGRLTAGRCQSQWVVQAQIPLATTDLDSHEYLAPCR